MTKKQVFDIFKIEDMHDLPSVVNKVLLLPLDERDQIYSKLLEANSNDLSKDWFQSIYEDELAQRRENKQDFTPNSVGIILSKLTGNSIGEIYEPTAGNGSLLIANWWHRKKTCTNFKCEEHPINCWELSARSIPILLLNLSIRGITGIVNHGDVLSQNKTAVYMLYKTGDYSIITKQ